MGEAEPYLTFVVNIVLNNKLRFNVRCATFYQNKPTVTVSQVRELVLEAGNRWTAQKEQVAKVWGAVDG